MSYLCKIIHQNFFLDNCFGGGVIMITYIRIEVLIMNGKKTIIISVAILLLVLVGALGASYAYFATVNKTTGNDKDLNIVTEDLGNIKWQGTKVFESSGLLPGEMGIQTFTVEKNSITGKGIYEIDLKGILDESFGSDVEISLYKSTNPTTDNVTIIQGNSATDAGADNKVHYYKEDTLKINGSPKKVYGPKALKNKNPIILEQADFDNSTLQKTTYYLVYHYKNADTAQDAQQGKSFSGEISVKLILEKNDQCELDDEILACSILSQAKNDTTNLATDDYGNTRYIGKDPNNYVSVDGDIWRIIGVMKDVDDGTGNKEDRVKLIRASSIGGYSWDTSESSVNGGYGVNEWSQADLMKLLNPGYESESVGGSLYWNSGAGTCYSGSDNSTTSCNFTSTGIKDKLKTLISDAVWNTGSQGTNDYTSASGGLTKHFYAYERSDNTGKICSSGTYCNDTVERTTTWTGKVGLMYPSDYGYATSGGSITDRATCLNTVLYNWSDSSVNDCKYNDWLFNDIFNNDFQWTILPGAVPFAATVAGIVNGSGSGDGSDAFNSQGVRPVVYLTSNVRISGGEGTSESPFELSL